MRSIVSKIIPVFFLIIFIILSTYSPTISQQTYEHYSYPGYYLGIIAINNSLKTKFDQKILIMDNDKLFYLPRMKQRRLGLGISIGTKKFGFWDILIN